MHGIEGTGLCGGLRGAGALVRRVWEEEGGGGGRVAVLKGVLH